MDSKQNRILIRDYYNKKQQKLDSIGRYYFFFSSSSVSPYLTFLPSGSSVIKRRCIQAFQFHSSGQVVERL